MATGKIARLPRDLRETLNGRMQEGVTGRRLAAWLNALPEVRQLLDRDFGGAAISEQNLTNWRHGGHREWLAEKHFQESFQGLGKPAMTTEQMVAGLGLRYLKLAINWKQDREYNDARHWRRWRQMCQDVLKIHRRELAEKQLAMAQVRAGLADKTKTPAAEGASRAKSPARFKDSELYSPGFREEFTNPHVLSELLAEGE